MASFAYTFQIYFDFSGYSDMALGLCLMLGFRLPENFNFPYISASITEFWRRWHISLGSWMKNYVYIPLGGNRLSVKRGYMNLSIVFLISGFWHGASWNYIIWGAFHGIFLIMERLFLSKLTVNIPRMVKAVAVLFIVNISWVIFRTEDLEHLKIILVQMFTFYSDHTIDYDITYKFYCILAIALFIAMSGLIKKWETATQDTIMFYTRSNKRTISMTFLCLLLAILCLANVVAADFDPFIYFRF
jgi:alginate O-acetyltransferase complex protein AlgI